MIYSLLAAITIAPAFSRELTIRAIDGLRFAPPRIQADPGETLKITFQNKDSTDLPHNLIIGKPESLQLLQRAAMDVSPESQANGYVPTSEEVIAASGLLNSDQSQILTFQVPDEPGIYPYVCTFPGHATVMYGACYVGTEVPPLFEDAAIPRSARMENASPPEKSRRPDILRVFMPRSGPASIAVALPGDWNYCWDAGSCRLRYIWKGDFIETEHYYSGPGNVLAKVPAKPFWSADEGFPLSLGKPHFKGYAVSDDGIPTFRYVCGEILVEETIAPNQTNGIDRQFSFTPPLKRSAMFSPESKKKVDYFLNDQKVPATPFEINGPFTLTLRSR